MPDTTPIAPPPLPKSQPPFGKRYRTIIKLIGVGLLILLLLIPLGMITGVLSDRLQRRNEAVSDITSSWGKEQCLIGPVLGIPYQYRFKTVKEVAGADGKLAVGEEAQVKQWGAHPELVPDEAGQAGHAEHDQHKRSCHGRSMQADHYFRNLPSGATEMKDLFRVAAPLPILGLLAEALFLRRYMRMLLRERNTGSL